VPIEYVVEEIAITAVTIRKGVELTSVVG